MNPYYELTKLAFPELLAIDGKYEYNFIIAVIVSILKDILTLEEANELVEYFDSTIKQELINLLSEEDKKLIVQELAFIVYSNNMIYVKTDENLNKLLIYAELLGYEWLSGHSPLDYSWSIPYPSDILCIYFKEGLTYAELSEAKEHYSNTLIDFKPIEDFLPPNFYVIKGEY